MDRRAAFARACGFLNFRPAARALALGSGVVSSLLLPVAIFFLGLACAVALGEARGQAWYRAERPGEALVGFAVIVGIAALVFLLLRYVMFQEASRAAAEACLRLRRAVYHQALRLGTTALRPAEAGDLAQHRVAVLHDALLTHQTGRWPALVQFVAVILLALLANPWLALAGLVVGGLLRWLQHVLTAAGRPRVEQATQQRAAQLASFGERLAALGLVKAHAAELHQQDATEAALAALATAEHQCNEAEVRRQLGLGLGRVVAGFGLTALAAVLLLGGQLQVSDLLVVSVCVVAAGWASRDWQEQQRRSRRGEVAAVELFAYLDRPGDVSQTVGAEPLPRLARRIEFDNVSLNLPGGKEPLLDEVSLVLPAGQRLGIVGPDEADRHALFYLMARLLDPTSGEIRIDEHNLRWVTLDSLRKQLGLVLWHNLVVTDTVAANITAGDGSIPMPRVMEAAKLAHAHQFIGKLPHGYDTVIGAHGHALTPGERFRVALARVILRNPALLLIEEPPAAQIDEDTRGLLEDTYARILPGRTAVFLPQREATVALCDAVLLLHGGRVAAQGTHGNLLQQSELYRHLFRASGDENARPRGRSATG